MKTADSIDCSRIATSETSNEYLWRPAVLRPPRKKRPRPTIASRRTLGVGIVISGMFFNGAIYGYTSPALPSFQQNLVKSEQENFFDTLLPNDLKLEGQEGLFTSLTQLGFPLGGLMSSVMVSFLGKRFSSLFGQAFSYIIGHCLIMTAWNVEMLLVGRFVCGLCQGFCNCLTIVYVLELCDSLKAKAICGVLLSLVGNAGTLITYTIGIFVNWRQLAAILLTFAIPYVLGLIMVLPNDMPLPSSRKVRRKLHNAGGPQSPQKMKTSSTEKFFDISEEKSGKSGNDKFYDIEQTSVNKELVEDDNDTYGQSGMLDVLKNLICCKSLYVDIGFMFFYQFAGYVVITNYAGSILQRDEEEIFNITESESNIKTVSDFGIFVDPALVSASFVGLAGLFGVIIGVIFVHRGFNRKKILLFSAMGTAMAFIGLGIQVIQSDPNGIPIVETLCLVMHVAIFNLGYGCLGYPMMAELLPSKLRTSGLAFIMVVGGLFGFASSMSFVQLEAFILQQNIFFTYAAINLLGLAYLIFFLPNMETISQ